MGGPTIPKSDLGPKVFAAFVWMLIWSGVASGLLMALGLFSLWSDHQMRHRSELERCFHHADYGEPPCDGPQWVGE